jgi:hemerythrin-like domain-containing protein
MPAAVMKRAHHEKLRLCEALEELADSLQGQVDHLKCIGIASTLVPLLRSVHQYEEEMIYPVYEAAVGGAAGQVSSRLRAEHLEDECFADEVTEILMAIGHGEALENTEAVGFMLRGLIETMRRHIAFESENILPLMNPIDAD